IASYAECTVVHVATGTACNLPHLVRTQKTHADAIEFFLARECDVIDIHVYAHADGVGRHQKIDVAALVEFDLRIARARTECAEDDGRSASLAPDELRDAIDIVGRKSDHRR